MGYVLIEVEIEGRKGGAYVDSARKRFTLCIVMRAVGDEDIMMMGYIVPAKWRLENHTRMWRNSLTRFLHCSLRVCEI